MEISEYADPRVGTVLNQKYTLHRLIGSGGMASVYEASHRNGYRVAIKILHSDLAEQQDFRERFLREGYVANKVDHPGAVRVLDDDVEEDGSVFLVMELLEGSTLDDRCKQAGGRMPVRKVCVLAYHLLEVLAAAHEKGVVHRDIKPENLFLTEDGTLKVLDFGIARLLETTEANRATRTGTVIGTPAFMAPEQALGQWSVVDRQSDLWAVGATMFALISGELVHDAETLQEMMVRAGSREARRVRSVAQHVPPRIADVVDKALAFRKVERWPDAWTMGSRLREAYLFSFGEPIVAERARSPSSMPRSIAPTVGPVRTVAPDDRHSVTLLSTPNGLSREKVRPAKRTGRALALAFLALSSATAGAIVASRKEPSVAVVVTPASPPPLLLLPAPFPCATSDEELPHPPPSSPGPVAEAAPVSLSRSTAVDAAGSSALAAPAPTTSLGRTPVLVQPPLAISAVQPVDGSSITVRSTPPATASAAPSESASAAPSATATPDAAFDPTFGL